MVPTMVNYIADDKIKNIYIYIVYLYIYMADDKFIYAGWWLGGLHLIFQFSWE
jgi:hypothetical protein